MIRKITAIAVIAAALTACVGQESHDMHAHDGRGKSQDPLDSIRGLVMAAHDVAMPKIGQLKGLQDLLGIRIDSLKKAGASAVLIAEAETMRQTLANAEKGMNDWMDQFAYEPEMSDDSARAYMIDQQQKAEAMSKAILSGLDSAKALLGQ